MEPTSDRLPRIEVDWDRCTGLGICESMAPEHFEVQEDGSLLVRQSEVHRDCLDEVRSAVESCPTEALKLVSE